ncbi:MAG: PDZ domain-containing protein [Desulfuromonadales bacterium]|nr:PDZ domain-containing protein [Desulfuromonadales bacterium]NIR33785.1 PDZ domain-containing protein [Desulfuromonadales bacterium]NIS42469.1 PDZ domain-containing protein [Desulfuromonadales bacterium]
MIRIRLALVVVLSLFLCCLNSPCVAQEKFAGTGIQAVPIVSGELVVLDVVSGSPAERAGLHPGDLIVQVDDYPLKGSEFADVVRKYLWGEAGESLSLIYLRPGLEGRFSRRLVREPLTGEVEKIPGIRLMQPGETE